MNETPRARVLVGAALPLLAFPIAVAAYAVFVSDDHRLDRTIIVVWQDNKVALSVLAGVGLLATLGSSLLLFSGLQRSSAAMFGVIPLSALVSLVGVGVAALTVQSNFVSSGGVNGVDLPFFVLAVFAEGLRLLGGAVFVSLALLTSAGLAHMAAGSRAGVAGSVVCLAGGGATGLVVFRLIVLTDAIDRMVHGQTRAMVAFLVRETSVLGPSRVPAAALVVVLFVVLGAVLLRKEPRLSLMLVVLGVSAAVPAASLPLASSLMHSASRALIIFPVPQSLVPLRGRLTNEPVWRLGRDGIELRAHPGLLDARAVEVELAQRLRVSSEVSVALERGARCDELVTFLDASMRAGSVAVGLVGQSDANVTVAPSELRPLLEQFRTSFQVVSLRLARPDEERQAQFVLTRTTDLESLILSAEEATARAEPLVVHVRP